MRTLRRAVATVVIVLVVPGLGYTVVRQTTTPLSPQRIEIGVTHGERSADLANAPAAVDRAVSILGEYTDLGNQHIMGWGALNPAPRPDKRDWASLDSRIALLDRAGTTPVITLCCAPDWMKGGPAGTTDWSRLEVAPSPEFYDDFAELAAEVATRYPQVKHFVVWNELKGFFDADGNRWDATGYTELYNKVYSRLKAISADIKVGGPYVVVDSWSPERASHPSALSGPWGVVDQRSLDVISYWLANNVGADFLAVDGASATKDRGLLTSPQDSNEKFAAVSRWLTSRSSLPVWWMEIYPSVPDEEDEYWSSELRSALTIDAILRIADAGGSAVLLWQPEGDDRFFTAALWSPTTRADGGRSQPLVARLAMVRDAWARGMVVVRRWSGDDLVLTTTAPLD